MSVCQAQSKGRASMRLGEKAKIWRDEKLTGNDVFALEIIEQFPHTALLVSVLTPRYLNAAWCAKEVQAFCHSAQHSGGVVVENKAGVFAVSLPATGYRPRQHTALGAVKT